MEKPMIFQELFYVVIDWRCSMRKLPINSMLLTAILAAEASFIGCTSSVTRPDRKLEDEPIWLRVVFDGDLAQAAPQT
jgi:hypothetical protein